MRICDEKHEEIVIDAYRGCSICTQITKLEREIEKLNDEITSLRDTE